MKKILTSMIFGILVSGCGGQSGEEKLPETYSVTYSVTGLSTSSASITYENSTGGTSQETITLPWSKSLTFKRDAFLYISAQNKSNIGTVTVSIKANNITIKTSTSNGAYAIATASGSCCS
jgi:hypothetical protein